ncbi:hypothetical protein ACIA7S_31185 [Streptomyces sp. NPDC051643]|uniref:hypothetical protein n=2 Tax=Streptomyces TaxID=1883 RepID=UPI003793E62D
MTVPVLLVRRMSRPRTPDAPVVAIDLLQLSEARFETATRLGAVGPQQRELVDNALRAVLMTR